MMKEYQPPGYKSFCYLIVVHTFYLGTEEYVNRRVNVDSIGQRYINWQDRER
jgi:hypothetical protein